MNLAINTKNISKSYPGVLANSNVSVQIEKSSIHAIVGENGAGKSTLMKILYGMTTVSYTHLTLPTKSGV